MSPLKALRPCGARKHMKWGSINNYLREPGLHPLETYCPTAETHYQPPKPTTNRRNTVYPPPKHRSRDSLSETPFVKCLPTPKSMIVSTFPGPWWLKVGHFGRIFGRSAGRVTAREEWPPWTNQVGGPAGEMVGERLSSGDWG